MSREVLLDTLETLRLISLAIVETENAEPTRYVPGAAHTPRT